VPNETAVIAFDGSDPNVARLAKIFSINLTDPEPATLIDLSDLNGDQGGERQAWDGVRLLVVGTPTVDRGPSPATTAWLDQISAPDRRLAIAAFDLRRRGGWMRKGNGAGQVSKALRKAGFIPEMGTETFYLEGETDTLEEGQLERAAKWSYGLGLATGTRP
jgi:hypothetical protein